MCLGDRGYSARIGNIYLTLRRGGLGWGEEPAWKTDVKQVFDYIRFSGDKQKLKELIENNAAYGMLDEETYNMVASYVENSEVLKIKEKHRKGREM